MSPQLPLSTNDPHAPHDSTAHAITAIVLAAGRSQRMGHINKLLLPLQGRPLLLHMLDALAAGGVHQRLVVTGHDAGAVEAALAGRSERLVTNPDYASGMASSIRAGVEAAPMDTGGLLIGLADMPHIRPSTIRRLVDAFVDTGREEIVLPTYQGQDGHPVIFPARLHADLLALDGDRGARTLLQAENDRLQRLAVDDPGVLLDIDTPKAYVRERRRAGSRDRPQ